MARDYSIWIRRIKGTLPPDSSVDADGSFASTHLFAVAVSGEGKRITIPPRPFFASTPESTYDITRNTITPKWKFGINDNDTEHLFCIWMLEADNLNIRDNWAAIEQTFHRLMDENTEKIQNRGYPLQQMNFLALTESIIQLHLKVQLIKSTPSWPGYNNDDVYLPGVFHFAHVPGNTLPPDPGLIYVPARNHFYEGFCDGICFIDPQHSFELTFRYEYSPAGGPVLSED
jgi:hypothetical protein